jgi:arylsulfatase A-like enzyme
MRDRCRLLVAALAAVLIARRLAVTLAPTLAPTLALTLALTLRAQQQPPNVVMIISDDQAWNDFGFMGHEEIRTPHLDRLARQSALFPRGYVTSSLCRPSLATLITGLYPHQHKIVGNDPPAGTDRAAMLGHIRRTPTLPRLLGEHGYLSRQSGKWWEGHFSEGGFTHGMTHGDPTRGGRHGDDGLAIGRRGMEPIFDFIDEARAQDGGPKPFFLWYAPFLPHTPHNPPQRLLERYTAPGKSIHVARYQAMCEWFDETCGQLLDRLDRDGLADNTLVVLVVDNGWIQDPDSPRFAPRSKRSPYDGGVRTPILLRWPGRIRPATLDVPVSSIDLAPTILAACGLKPTADMHGVNLLDVCAGRAPDREAIFGEVFEHDVVDVDNPAKSLQYRWTVSGRWKLILPVRGEAAELYDIVADPHERRDLAADEPQTVRHLSERIEHWWSEASPQR